MQVEQCIQLEATRKVTSYSHDQVNKWRNKMEKAIKLTFAALLAVILIHSEALAKKRAPQSINKASLVLDRVQACKEKYSAGLAQCHFQYDTGIQTQMDSCEAEQETRLNLCELAAHRSIQ